MRRALIIALAASAIALAGCASVPLPAPKGENDCLVVIRTRVENPKHLQVVRNNSFQLSSGGHEKLMPTSPSSYMAFVIDQPDVRIATRHTNVVAEGWTGAAQEIPMNFPLPYRAGYVVIVSQEFVNSIEPWGSNGGSSTQFSTPPLGEDGKAKLIEEVKAREGIGAWRLEE